jgi:protein-L-isoaspartate(D-aspartate) O-methyltransferase
MGAWIKAVFLVTMGVFLYRKTNFWHKKKWVHLQSLEPKGDCPMSSSSTHSRLIHDLIAQGIIRTPAVIDVMASLDRALFVPLAFRHRAYDDHPVPIGGDATISAPHMHGICLELFVKTLESSHPPHKILDVGSGSGYLTLAFYLLAKTLGQGEPLVVGIDCDPDLVQQSVHTAQRILPGPLKDQRILFLHGDGWLGHESCAPYDAIHVGAAAPHIPEALENQLRCPGGRLVIPIGLEGCPQDLTIIDVLAEGDFKSKKSIAVQYVPLRQLHENSLPLAH